MLWSLDSTAHNCILMYLPHVKAADPIQIEEHDTRVAPGKCENATINTVGKSSEEGSLAGKANLDHVMTKG